MSENVNKPAVRYHLANYRNWPVIPLADLVTNRVSECVERQVTGPFQSYSRGLYKRSVKEQNRPVAVIRIADHPDD